MIFLYIFLQVFSALEKMDIVILQNLQKVQSDKLKQKNGQRFFLQILIDEQTTFTSRSQQNLKLVKTLLKIDLNNLKIFQPLIGLLNFLVF